jgi:integrase
MVTLRALCNWAREQYASDDEYPLLPVNPVTRMFKVRRKNPERARTRRLPIEKVGEVWAMLKKRRVEGRTVEDRVSAAFVSFLLLTGARRGETGSLVWDDVHLDHGWLRFDSAVTKNHTELRLPITRAMDDFLSR